MLQLSEETVKAIVDHPEQVRVNGVEGESSMVME
jgi:predicted RNA-binding protein YlqC (UPF0109 family)